jgi:hypothetical protein
VDRLCRPSRFAPLLLCAAAALSALFARRGLPLPDEGAMLTNAAKILRGGVFYADIDAYPFPAATYALALAMQLFGEHFTVARAFSGALYCGSLVALYRAALVLLGRRRAALFGLFVLALKPLAWPAFTLFLYSEFAFFFGCLALALLVGGGWGGARGRLALAGVCVGVAVLSKQNLGMPLAGAVGLVLILPVPGAAAPTRERVRAALVFALGAALPVVAFLACCAAAGVLGTALWSGLVRPFTGYLPASGVPFGRALAWWELGGLASDAAALAYLPIVPWQLASALGAPGQLGVEILGRALYTSVVAAFVWCAARLLRPTTRRDARHGVAALALVALAFAASAWPRADFYHVAGVYPVVALLLFALGAPAAGSRAPRATAAAVGVLLVLAGATAASYAASHNVPLDLARADLRVAPEEAWFEVALERIVAEVEPGEPIFVYGHEAYYYFLTDRYFPWPFAQLYPGQTGEDSGAALARLLAREAPRLVVRGLQETPGLPRIGSYAPELARRLSQGFARDDLFFEGAPGGGPSLAVLAVLRRSP